MILTTTTTTDFVHVLYNYDIYILQVYNSCYIYHYNIRLYTANYTSMLYYIRTIQLLLLYSILAYYLYIYY